MQKTQFLSNSLKYIFVSGISKGFNYLILLYFAVGIYTEQYITILLLLSFEQLLSLTLPLNNSSIIYSKKIEDYGLITNKLISSSLLLTLVYVLGFFLIRDQIYKYFNINEILIFISIFISIIINAYLVYLSNYYKLVEKHNSALLIQLFFLISFISIVAFIFVIENKILAFFLGKTTGLLLILIFLKAFKLDLIKFKFKLLTLDEVKKIANLFSVGILGWISGLGFINLAKMYASPENLITIGYVLNLWNIFLLISIGINAVYHPLIKKQIINNKIAKAKKLKNKALIIYLFIGLLFFMSYLIIQKTEMLVLYPKINAIFSVIPYTIILFVFSVFYYVIHPFYLANDKFGIFNILNIISYAVWVFVMLIGVHFGFKNYLYFLFLLYFLKSIFLYIYAEKKLITTNEDI
jgi:hypothetical protein